MNFSLGLIEIQALGHAIFVLDAMTKAADVEFVATERKLGGRLVTLVVKGNVSAVTAAIEAGVEVIAKPNTEILKFLHLDKNGKIISPSAPKAAKPEVKEVKVEDTKKVSKAAKPASDKKPSPKKEASKK